MSAKKTPAKTTKKAAKERSAFEARVTVMPRRAVLDPQGQAIRQALDRLGFKQISALHAGKCFTVTLAAPTAGDAEQAVDEMCRKLLANPVIENYQIEMLGEVEESEP